MQDRFVYLVVAILAAAALYACWCGAPLIWDGAYQLNWTLIRQEPFVYRTRFHTLILWWPVALLSRYTSNPTAIYMAYGLPFLLAPAVGVLVSWWILRRQSPSLILWVIFGVAIGPLPGQIFIINDSIFQQHLFWPLFASLFARLSWRQSAVLAALAVFQFAHPIGGVLLLGIAAAALGLAVLDRERRRLLVGRAGVAMLLGAAALWKTIHYPDPYAVSEFTWAAAKSCWYAGVSHCPIWGISFMWAAGILALAGNSLDQACARRLRRPLIFGALGCAVAGAVIWICWAADTHLWRWASEYRRWVVPLTAPFCLLAWLDYVLKIRRGRSKAEANQSQGETRGSVDDECDRPTIFPYAPFGILLACVFAAVLSVQSTLFHRMTSRLLADMRRWPGTIVPQQAVAWSEGTALQHWTLTDLAIALQGKNPRQLLVNPKWVRFLYGLDGRPPVFPNYEVYPHPPEPNGNGWYDMRPILEGLPAEPPF